MPFIFLEFLYKDIFHIGNMGGHGIPKKLKKPMQCHVHMYVMYTFMPQWCYMLTLYGVVGDPVTKITKIKSWQWLFVPSRLFFHFFCTLNRNICIICTFYSITFSPNSSLYGWHYDNNVCTYVHVCISRFHVMLDVVELT